MLDPVVTLNAARRGDEAAFAALTEPHRHELQVHCYRMLGSPHDAEDMVQETLLRAWKRLETFEARASFRAWLYKIATNACLDLLDKQNRRKLATSASESPNTLNPPITEMPWLEPFPYKLLPETNLSVDEQQIAQCVSFLDPKLFPYFTCPPKFKNKFQILTFEWEPQK